MTNMGHSSKAEAFCLEILPSLSELGPDDGLVMSLRRCLAMSLVESEDPAKIAEATTIFEDLQRAFAV